MEYNQIPPKKLFSENVSVTARKAFHGLVDQTLRTPRLGHPSRVFDCKKSSQTGSLKPLPISTWVFFF